jgi:hypothetical protein
MAFGNYLWGCEMNAFRTFIPLIIALPLVGCSQQRATGLAECDAAKAWQGVAEALLDAAACLLCRAGQRRAKAGLRLFRE